MRPYIATQKPYMLGEAVASIADLYFTGHDLALISGEEERDGKIKQYFYAHALIDTKIHLFWLRHQNENVAVEEESNAFVLHLNRAIDERRLERCLRYI